MPAPLCGSTFYMKSSRQKVHYATWNVTSLRLITLTAVVPTLYRNLFHEDTSSVIHMQTTTYLLAPSRNYNQGWAGVSGRGSGFLKFTLLAFLFFLLGLFCAFSCSFPLVCTFLQPHVIHGTEGGTLSACVSSTAWKAQHPNTAGSLSECRHNLKGVFSVCSWHHCAWQHHGEITPALLTSMFFCILGIRAITSLWPVGVRPWPASVTLPLQSPCPMHHVTFSK